MNRLGQKVKEARIKKGWTPKALAKKAGISESYLLEAEDGKKIMNENLVHRISKILKVNLDESGDIYAPAQETGNKKSAGAVHRESDNAPFPARQAHTPAESPTPQWEQAFSTVLKDVQVYTQDLSRVLCQKKLVIQDNRVEGIPMDKAFFVRIDQETDLDRPELRKGDLVLVQKTSAVETAGVYIVRFRDRIRIGEIKPLGGGLLLLGSRGGTREAETVNARDLSVIGKCIKAEISF